ncbi:hypothetical protein DV515_00003939 [Chloebia gouldiae]|uniref:Uncharacterized protein n=1 Tax=Chloebia gouldiae TaxID=44316 RepID=A0A3L8SS19_CHLGU|nr:hypothetical protein DV515_00003939 [Chloebia gouldiae]
MWGQISNLLVLLLVGYGKTSCGVVLQNVPAPETKLFLLISEDQGFGIKHHLCVCLGKQEFWHE